MEVKPESAEGKGQPVSPESVSHPVMNVVAPPPASSEDKTSDQPPVVPPPLNTAPAVVSASVPVEAEKNLKKLDKTPRPAKAGGVKKSGDGVIAAIVATVIIVLGLATLSVYAYIKTK
jgi:hypothetical protein